MNKADLLPDVAGRLPIIRQDEIWISARTQDGLSEMIDMITGILYKNNRTMKLRIPFSRGDLLNILHSQAEVITEEYDEQGAVITADCPENLSGELEEFCYAE